MLDHYTITKCTCGYGEGFYHFAPDGHHEFNPGKPEAEATQDYHDDRAPFAWFFCHVDGKHVQLFYFNHPPMAFSYSEHGSKQQALAAAAQAVLELWRAPELF